MKLKDDFRNDLVPIIDVLSTTRLPPEKYFKSIDHEGKFLAFPNEIYPQYLGLKKTLRLKANTAGKLISDDAIEGKLDDFLIKIKYANDQKKVKSEIQKEIALLFNDIRNMQSIKHLFVIPVMNLQIEQDIAIGDSLIVNFNEDFLASLESKYKLNFSFKEEDLKESVLKLPKENQTRTFASVIVQAPDDTKALELAIQKADTCLNILRLYGQGSPFVIREEYVGSITQRLIHLNLANGTYGELGSALNISNHFPAVLKKDTVNQFQTNALAKINSFLTKDEDSLTQLQGDLLKAILWFGNAVKENQNTMKFVKGIAALEALLIPDGGIAKSEVIAKRFVSITFSSAPDTKKKEIFNEMRSMYQLRSSIIHSGDAYVYDDDLQKMMSWVQATIKILLSRADKYSNLKEATRNEFPINDKLYTQQTRKKTLKKFMKFFKRR